MGFRGLGDRVKFSGLGVRVYCENGVKLQISRFQGFGFSTQASELLAHVTGSFFVQGLTTAIAPSMTHEESYDAGKAEPRRLAQTMGT